MIRFPLGRFLLFCWVVSCGPVADAAEFLPQAKHVIVCFGDSITGAKIYEPMMQDLIDQRYPERAITVLSRGISRLGRHRRPRFASIPSCPISSLDRVVHQLAQYQGFCHHDPGRLSGQRRNPLARETIAEHRYPMRHPT